MNPISNPNPNPNQLDPFLLPPYVPYLENPNSTFTTSVPFGDCVSSPLPPLFPTYNSSTYGEASHSFAFPYPLPDNPLGMVKREDGIGIGIGIGLNLGQRTYFNTTTRSLFGFGAYGSGQNLNPPRCQVDGCKNDLTGAKHYHRRHKVCEFHSKAPMVLIGGLQERFCQQCSRFHVVAEFDEAKRSCRKRLADHNRRRRKPQLVPSNNKDPIQASHKIKSSTTTSTTSSPNYKPTNDNSSITNNSTASMSSTSCNLEGCHAEVPNKLQTLEKLNGSTTTLSLGEVAKLDSEFSNQSLNIYHEQNQGALPFDALIEEKQPFYHHQNTFSSSSSSNKGQTLFQVDFM